MERNRKAAKCGQVWIANLKRVKPLFDHAETWAANVAESQEIEHAAANYLDTIKRHSIPEGIQSCINRGSSALGLIIPTDVIGTAAFARVRLWGRKQGLLLFVSHHPKCGQDEIMLTVLPNQRGIAKL